MYVAQGSAPQFYSTSSMCGGNMILSRFPIIRSEERVFSTALFEDSSASIGAVYAEIEINIKRSSAHAKERDLEQFVSLKDHSNEATTLHKGFTPPKLLMFNTSQDKPTARLHLFTTQLQSTHSLTQDAIEAVVECRLQQLIELHDFIKEQTKAAQKNDLIMLMGDFNISAMPVSKLARLKVLAESNR